MTESADHDSLCRRIVENSPMAICSRTVRGRFASGTREPRPSSATRKKRRSDNRWT